VQLILANGGSCFLPERMAAPYLADGRLHAVPDSPRFRLPAYVVYPLDSDSPELAEALASLRALAAEPR